MTTSTDQHRPAGTAVPALAPTSKLPQAAAQSCAPGSWADLRGADRIVTTGVVTDVRTFPGTTAWSPPT